MAEHMAGGNSSRRANLLESGALAAAQEQAFRVNPGLQVCFPSWACAGPRAALSSLAVVTGMQNTSTGG